MSASSKKKLRNEQEAVKLTERQLAEQKEAKKLKLYTAAFVVVLVLLLVIAVTVGITQTISNSGVREKKTVAMTIGDHEISNAELNYYYMSTVNSFYSQDLKDNMGSKSYQAGDTATITFVREGKVYTTELTFGSTTEAEPTPTSQENQTVQPPQGGYAYGGDMDDFFEEFFGGRYSN